jgi:hypothetical protein
MARFDHYESCPRCTDNGRDRGRDNLAIYSDGGSHCFSCGYHRGGLATGNRSVLIPSTEQLNGTKVLPSDFTREVPARAWEWLLQYGLSWKYWSPFVGWSEKDQRLVFTIGEPVSFSMGRFLGRPEAFTREPRKWFVYGNSHTAAHLFRPETEGRCCVLVEDLISAHKVGQVTSCIPLFGTKVFNAVVPVIRHLGLPVLMWLDKDQESAAAKRATWLSMVSGLPVSYVFSDKDPKSLPTTQIMEIVNELS